MAYNNIYDNNIKSDYPTYPFPYEYTKSGQRDMMVKMQSADYVDSIQPSATITPTSDPPANTMPRLNIATLLPLVKAISSKGKLSTSDMMKTFVPLLGENSKNLGELISAFDTISSSKTPHKSKIESYTRVDNSDT